MTSFILQWLLSSVSGYLTFILFRWADSEGGLVPVIIATCLVTTGLVRFGQAKAEREQLLEKIRGR